MRGIRVGREREEDKIGKNFLLLFTHWGLKIKNLTLENTLAHTYPLSFSILDWNHLLEDTVKNWEQVPSLRLGQITLVDNGFERLFGGQAKVATVYA